jgi:ABC-type amino acid transport substrate-binding protein
MKRKSMQKLMALLICFTLILAGCSSATTETKEPETPTTPDTAELPATDIPKKLTVGLMTGFAPFEWQNDDGTVDGYDVKVIKEAASRLGIELDFLVVPWESLLTSLDAGKCDVVSTQLWRTEERLTRYHMGKVPYFEAGGRILVHVDTNDINKLEDLKGRKIGTTVGDAWTTLLETYNDTHTGDEALNITYYSEDISTIIQDIVTGRVVATMNDPTVMMDKAKALGVDDKVKLVGELYNSGCTYLAYQKSDEGLKLRDMFDEVYLEMIKDGTISRICKETFDGQDYTGNLMQNIVTEE